ncbi:MAG: type II toxin-antitoxin system RelE/ParE family toxin [Xanthobacteraceae bacterium]
MKVRYTLRARSDLLNILAYLEGRSPAGAQNVRRSIKKTIELIGEYPRGGRLAGEQESRVLPVGRYPYLIYWSIDGGEVWIAHIRHAARRRPETKS